MATARNKLGLAIGALALLVYLPAAQAVPYLDLTAAGSTGFWNDAYFIQVDPQSTGTGVIEPFVRLQANGTERGYNTDGTLEFDTKASIWTHSLLLSDVPVVDIGGTFYREFILDLNERNSASYISLDAVQIFLASAGDLSGYPSLGTEVFDLDVGPNGDGYIWLDYALDNGSGSGDLLMYIPNSRFGVANAPYVYLYSEFGADHSSDAGFEEWAVREGTTPPPPPPGVPVPGAALLVLIGGSLAISWQKRHMI